MLNAGDYINKKYEVIDEITETLVSKVYSVKNLAGKKFIAKVVPMKRTEYIGVYRNEVKILKELQHDHIVKLVDAGEDEKLDIFYIITEFIDGYDFNKYFCNGIQDEPSLRSFIDIILNLLPALEYIHQKSYVHKDIKPSNIRIDYNSKPYLLDFGISQIMDTIINKEKSEDSFSLIYISPEQVSKLKITNQTDIYQLGITMIEVLSSKDNFQLFSDNEISISDIIGNIGEAITHYSEEIVADKLVNVIQKATEADIRKRYKNDKDIINDLIEVKNILPGTNKYEMCVWEKVKDDIVSHVEEAIDSYSVAEYLTRVLREENVFAQHEIDREGRDKFTFATSKFTLSANSTDNTHFFIFGFLPFPKDHIYKNGILIDDEFIISIQYPEKRYNQTDELKYKIISDSKKTEKMRNNFRKDRDFLNKSEVLLKKEREIFDNKKYALQYKDFIINRGDQEIILDFKDQDGIINDENLRENKYSDFIKYLGDLNFVNKEITNRKELKLYLNSITNNESYYLRNKKILHKLISSDLLKDKVNKEKVLNKDMLINMFHEYLKHENDNNDFSKVEVGNEVGIFANIFDEYDARLSAEISKVDNVNLKISIRYKQKLVKENVIPKSGYLKYFSIKMESMLNKKERALSDLKNKKTVISDLLSRISRVNILSTKSEMPDLDKYYDDKLDQNQKLAVKKAMSLDNNEYLVIQGPPGTGKTTVITEIIKQIVSQDKKAKVLVASQSNQAVDNVLEKLVLDTDIKAARFGENDSKFNEIGVRYAYEKVSKQLLDQMINRIKTNDMAFSDYTYRDELLNLRKKWLKTLQGSNEDLETLLLKNINVIFGTLVSIANKKYDFINEKFDYVIIDEAGRATLPELSICMNKARRFILVGDHKQLPPIYDEQVVDEAKNQGYTKDEIDKTVFHQLYEELEQKSRNEYCHKLKFNYRMNPDICNLVSNLFYDGDIQTPYELYKNHDLNYKYNVIWYSTQNLTSRYEANDATITSSYNICNAKQIKKILSDINKQYHSKGLKNTIGIISPYREQINRLQGIIKPGNQEMWTNIDIEIATVDSFQGSDRDIIIFDITRSNPKNNLGFITDIKRLNVALSRAKKLLIIVGDAECAFNGKSRNKNPYKELLTEIRNNPEIYSFIVLEEDDDGK